MGFFEQLAEKERERELGSGSQNDTRGFCQGCGLVKDDVLLGYCGMCGLTPVRVTPVD